jgi:hypothetical protein
MSPVQFSPDIVLPEHFVSSFLLRAPPHAGAGIPEGLRFVKPNFHRVSRIKPDLATKCRTKPQRGFVISRLRFFPLAKGVCTEWLGADSAHDFSRNVQNSEQPPIIRSCSRQREMPVLKAPLSERRAACSSPPLGIHDTQSVSASAMAPASRRCAYFATLKRITAPREAAGRGPHPKRFMMGADSVCNRGTADPFESFVV